MQMPETLRSRLANEFRFAAIKMTESPDLLSKLFFFSAFYGEVARVFNQAWSSELALVHLVLQTVHQQASARVGALASGVEPAIGLAKGFPEALDRVANELAELFESKQIDDARLYQILARTAELTYATTGNGYYLCLKGKIKI